MLKFSSKHVINSPVFPFLLCSAFTLASLQTLSLPLAPPWLNPESDGQEAHGVFWYDPGKSQGFGGLIDVFKFLRELETEVLQDGGEEEKELHLSQTVPQAEPLS